MGPQNAAKPAPAVAGNERRKFDCLGGSISQQDSDYEAAAQGLKDALVAELRCARYQLAIAINEIDIVGVALRFNLVDIDTAIFMSQPILSAFYDHKGNSYIEEFCALVEEKRAEYGAGQKRRRKWRRAS